MLGGSWGSGGGPGGGLGGLERGPRRKNPCGRGSGGVRDPCFSRGGKMAKNVSWLSKDEFPSNLYSKDIKFRSTDKCYKSYI